MAVRPAYFFRHVISKEADWEIVKVHCPHCRSGIYFIVTTILGNGSVSFDVRLNDQACLCEIVEEDWDELRRGAIQMPDTGEDNEDWWMLYGQVYPDHDGGPVNEQAANRPAGVP